jgi:hypothetical protein
MCHAKHYDGMGCAAEGYLLPGLEGASKGGLVGLGVGAILTIIAICG